MSRKIAHIVGLGKSGTAAAKWLLLHNWDVIGSDDADENKLSIQVKDLQLAGAVICLNGHTEALKVPVDLVVVSPGVPLSHPAIQARKAQGVEIIGELELGWRYSYGTIVAVTASNGKSTTTALLGEIFKATGRPTFIAGNIGTPFTSIIDKTSPESLIALEVSSYQLESIKHFKPNVAVLLNITPDHLQRHGTMEIYSSIKARLTMNQDKDDYLIYNIDDKIICDLVKDANSKKIPFSTQRKLAHGGWLEDDNMVFNPNAMSPKYIMPRTSLSIPGMHNTQNALAAILSALVCGIEWKFIEAGVQNFKGLPHRLEFVRCINSVKWFNDSKATNVDSGITALKALDRPIILIAGGRAKGGGFKDIRSLVKDKVKLLIVLGEAAGEIKNDLGDLCPTYSVENLTAAVNLAKEKAESGDTVLLSPLCASFDMFDNFEHRGDIFKQLVNEIDVNQTK